MTNINGVIQEYMRIVLSFPTACLVGIVLFVIFFRDALSSALNNIKRLDIGRLSFQAKQEPPEDSEPASATNIGNNDSTVSDSQWRHIACSWEYRYLNYFLVPRTQIILDWFHQYPRANSVLINFYDTIFQQFIPDSRERIAIIEALQKHHLISQLDGNKFYITEKGLEYSGFRGYPYVLK